MPETPELFIPEGFVCLEPIAAVTKLGEFALSGAENIHIVFDFDRTLTISKADTREDITTWQIMEKHLPDAARARCQELFDVYRPLEKEGRIKLDDAVAWWSQVLDLFVVHGVNMNEVEDDFLSKATIRPGAEEFFALAKLHEIPTVILSAGIKDIIEMWARTYGINPSLILSTDLVLDDDGRVVGWDEATLVHVLNKKEMGHAELSKLRASRPFTILVGDAVSDADMVEGQESVLRVMVHDPRPDEATSLKPPEEFDLVVVTGDLKPLTQLLQQIVTTG